MLLFQELLARILRGLPAYLTSQHVTTSRDLCGSLAFSGRVQIDINHAKELLAEYKARKKAIVAKPI